MVVEWEREGGPRGARMARQLRPRARRKRNRGPTPRPHPLLLLQPSGDLELRIGMHALTGKTLALDKPLAGLEKQKGGEGEGGDENADPAPAPVRYRVVGVIRRKCLFKARPRALIGRSR